MGFLDKMKNLFTDEIEDEPVKPIKSEVRQVEIPSPVKEEKKEDNIADSEIVKSEEKVSTPIFFDDDYFKELDQPKQEVKQNIIKEQPRVIKEEKKQFKPTPIISPVYGVLDKNYSKEDITTKKTNVEKTNTVITIDEVRRKAFGTLEDELENTLFGSNSILFNDEIKESKEEDLFDELIDLDEEENIVAEELSKTVDEAIDEGELFDLIDSMYEKGE